MAEDPNDVRPYAVVGRGPRRRDDKTAATALWGCGAIGLAILVTAAAAAFFVHPAGPASGVPATAAAANGLVAAAPVAAAPAVVAAAPVAALPVGAGVVASEVAGAPQVSVYFATAKADVTPDFARAAAPLKAWLAGHAGTRLHLSGYNDPRGDAAMNAALSKHRAQNVAAALAAQGVPATAIDLVKPAETTDTDDTHAAARRVDVTVADAH